LCRSLGAAGHWITHLRSSEKRGPADFSKYCKASHHIVQPEIDLEKAADRLVEALDGQDYLIPINDTACELAYQVQGRHSAVLVGPPPGTYQKAKDKHQAAQMLAPWLKSPESLLVERVEDARGARFPCFAKPIFSVQTVDGVIRHTNVSIARTIDDVSRKLRDTHPIPLMLQQPVTGPGLGINLAAFKGELLGVSITERLHEPGFGGGSSYRRSGEVTPDILAIATEAAKKLKWTGFLMIECKRSHDGLYFMELNCRPWGSIGLSIFAGADYPNLLIDAFEGRRSELRIARPGVYTRHLKKDFGWALRHPGDLPKWSLSLLRVFRGEEQFDLERWNDPGPAIAQLRPATVGKVADRLLGRADRATGPLEGRVLFVCKGNINRSAVAEQIARSLGMDAHSAGLMARQGRRISQPAEQYLSRLGLPTDTHRSSVLEKELAPGTSIVAFERRHLREIRRRAPGFPVFLLTEVAGERGGISDPEGQEAEFYERCFARIEKLLRKVRA
jgi:protein-tyrosine-phosphatase